MTYGYGPPPPAPAPAPAASGYPQYPQYQNGTGRGGHSGRGGRGGHGSQPGGRTEYHAPVPYGYQPPQHQPQPYAAQHPGQYPPAQHASPGPGAYPQHQQQWPDQGQPQHPHHPAQAALPAQNYHPNYAQHMYQQQPSYGPQQQQQQQQQQPPAVYGAAPPPQQPYAQAYPPPQQPSGPPQHWGAPMPSHTPSNLPHQQQFGATRGRGGQHGQPKAQPMGPPIRMGFDNGPPRDANAPVSTGYPAQPYPPHQGSGPYPPAPYQGYPPPAAPPVSGPPRHYDGQFQQSGGRHGRGGFHNNSFKQRSGFNDNKGRHHNNNHNNNSNNHGSSRKHGGGGGGPATPQAHHQKPDAASAGKKKKRKTNTLGLTPGDESDDDFDEESKLSELIGADAPEPNDITEWIAERKRNFPTKSRVKAKLAVEKDAASKNGEVKDERALALEREQQKADKLRRELEKVESSLKRKREQQDAGDEMRDVAASSSMSPSVKSENEAPEAMSTKPDPNANLPPPPKKADPTKHCKYYSTGGTCGKKGKCRFVHDAEVREAALKEREMNGGRLTLQQRLALNDKDQQDMTIVKAIKYLQEKGLMETKSKSANGAVANGHTTTLVTKSSLPPPPASGLPPQPPPSVVSPPTVRYQGWNLSGFGNTGVKNE